MHPCVITVAAETEGGNIGRAVVLDDMSKVTPATRKVKISFNRYEDWEAHRTFLGELAGSLGRGISYSRPGQVTVDPRSGEPFRSIDQNGVNVAEIEGSSYRYSIEGWLAPLSLTPAQVIAALRKRVAAGGPARTVEPAPARPSVPLPGNSEASAQHRATLEAARQVSS